MKKWIAFLVLSVSLCVQGAESLYEQKIQGLTDSKFSLAEFKGKSLLFVNIATRCGYTGQLKGLEALQQRFKDKNFSVIGIPSNDFGGQTPEAAEEVAKFCKLNYGVSFPLTEKVVVLGDSKHPLISMLVKNTGGKDIRWNFEKFLVDKDGNVKQRFSSSVKPDSAELIQAIEKNL